MELRQLKYYCALVEEKNFHKAAEKLFLTQPALSQQISNLEKNLGVQLINRNSRKIIPTEAGLVLYGKAKEIIEMADNAKKETINYNSNKLSGLLRIATSSMSILMSNKSIEFFKKHRDIFLEIKSGTHDTVMDYLNSGVSEIAITDVEEYDSKSIKKIILEEQSFNLVGIEEYLPKGKETIDIIELKNLPLIIDKSDHQMIRKACLKYYFEPTIVAYLDNTENKINLAKAGIGLSLTSETGAKLARENGLQTVKINGIDNKITKCIFWKDNYSLSMIAKEFITQITSDKGD